MEVYFPRVGWLPFDPTPGRELPGAGASATSPGFLDPFRRRQPPTALPATSQAPPESPPSTPPRRDARSRGIAAVRRSVTGRASRPRRERSSSLLCCGVAVGPAAGAAAAAPTRYHGAPAPASLSLLSADLTDGRLPLSAASTLDETAAMVPPGWRWTWTRWSSGRRPCSSADEAADEDLVARLRPCDARCAAQAAPTTGVDLDACLGIRLCWSSSPMEAGRAAAPCGTGFDSTAGEIRAAGSDRRREGSRDPRNGDEEREGRTSAGSPSASLRGHGGGVRALDRPRGAVSLILRSTPEIPAWPQLPRRSFLENMYVQFSDGTSGEVLDVAAERLWVRNEVPPDELIRLRGTGGGGRPRRVRHHTRVRRRSPRSGARQLRGLPGPPYIKGQVTGPVSFGLSVRPRGPAGPPLRRHPARGGHHPAGVKARWQERHASRMGPDGRPADHGGRALPHAIGLGDGDHPGRPDLSAAGELPDAAMGCLTGIHVCGGTAWEDVVVRSRSTCSTSTPPTIWRPSPPGERPSPTSSPRGACLPGAWSPTTRGRSIDDGESCGRRVLERHAGLDGDRAVSVDEVLAASFVSPACGTGSLPEDLALICFDLTTRCSAWLRERL